MLILLTLLTLLTTTQCNREWPCDSCRRRKVPDGCRYNETPLPGDAAKEATAETAAVRSEDASNGTNPHAGDGQVIEALAERAFINLGLEAADINSVRSSSHSFSI